MEIETKRAKYILIPQLGILVNSELEAEFAHFLPRKLDEKKLITSIKSERLDEVIEKRLCSVRSITFNVTEQCNFRCSYCTFSGNYKNVRTHNQKSMNFTTARKAVDLLITLISSKKRNLKVNSINMGFYGGEALLEFKLIQRIMNYAGKRFQEKILREKFTLEFQLNTNGNLLKDQIVDFLVEWDVKIVLTLDGPGGEHDKFRLTANGEKTWETIMNNLSHIKKKYPEYYKDKIEFLVTLHPFHDYKKIDEFYFDNTDLFDVGKVNAYFVNTLSLKKEVAKKFKKASFQYSRLNLRQAAGRLDSKLVFKTIDYNTKFTGMCFPGEAKLFVDVDGKFHICERIKSDLPIGDVENGIDYEKIRSIHRQWGDVIIQNRCWECFAWSFCGVCAAQSEEEDGVGIDCVYKDHAPKMLMNYLRYKEEEEKKQEQEMSTTSNSVIDYVRQL